MHIWHEFVDEIVAVGSQGTVDCAAALAAIDICDSDQDLDLPDHLGTITTAFRNGLKNMALESIEGPQTTGLYVRCRKRSGSPVLRWQGPGHNR